MKKVLIVDDELDMRIFLATLFKTSGYQAFTAKNGGEGLATARQVTPELIVLDVMMPKQGGALMYRGLKEDPALARIPLVMLSAVPSASFAHYLKMLGSRMGCSLPPPDAYLEKPVDHEALLAIAASLTDAASAHAPLQRPAPDG